MSDDFRWDDILKPPTDTDPTDGTAGDNAAGADEQAETPASSRREQRERSRESTRQKGRIGRNAIAWIVAVVTVLALGAGSVAFVWLNYEEQVRKVLGWEIPPEDYEGEGAGEATIVINTGDTGDVIAQSLVDAGVVKSFEAFYQLLLAQEPAAEFYPGNYQLAERMSAEAALAALQDPANRLENVALIQEGKNLDQAFEILSLATDIPAEEFEAVAEDFASLGVPADAPSLEGYLFPAKYTFDPGVDARTVLQTLVNRTFQALDTAGVAPDDRHRVLTVAALIQREAGSQSEDFYKVSRVIQNRLDSGMMLQFDSTSHYGYAWKHGERQDGGVFSTSEELSDDNPFNTYVITGLPIGPIGASGELAIDAALNPADGSWLYFVTVNLDTGETVFSETLAQHNAAVAQMQQWCRTTRSPNCD